MTMENQASQQEFPQEAGLYWARFKHYKWFNLLVEVMGTPPFLTWQAYNRAHLTVIDGPQGTPNLIFGPKIQEPEL